MSNVGIGLAASIVAVVEAVVVVSAIEDSMVVVASAVAVVSGVSMASVLVLSSEIIEDIVSTMEAVDAPVSVSMVAVDSADKTVEVVGMAG